MNFTQLLVAVLLTTASTSWAQTADSCKLFARSVAKARAPQKLHHFLDTQWNYLMAEFPELATSVGYPGQNDHWTDLSAEAIARREKELPCQLEALKSVDRAQLSGTDKVTYDLAVRRLETSIEGLRWPTDDLQLTHLNGIQIDLPDLLFSMPKQNLVDEENLIARLRKVPLLAQQTQALLKKGLADHVTPVKMFLERVPAQFDKLLTPKVEDSPLYQPFNDFPSAITSADKDRIRKEAAEVLTKEVYPALAALKTFLETEYIPNARQSTAWTEVPDGRAWYAYLVKMHTTTNQTPKELHDLGLREVERIKGEMEKIRDQVKFKGDLKAFNQFLLSDPKFYYASAADLMAGYRDLAKRIDPELPRLFRRLPRNTYGVREMPAYKAAEAPTAYYEPGSLEGARAGYFEANTFNLKARPKWGMEALTLHESVPGHHLQISIAQEIESLPEFRRNDLPTAFVEGWGLYAESLGEDLGLYKDPYSKYGQLSYEIWRAIRLVVDTGVHEFGWSRQKAIDYMMALVPKSQLETEVEIDRYITWPGQALAYKVGQLKFRDLREKARRELGPRFDLREFHDEVLRHGAVPLNVLEKAFNEWLQRKKAASVSFLDSHRGSVAIKSL